MKPENPLNQILYGPPGTGKTYHTINKAIEIIENRVVSDNEKREDLKAKFDKYKNDGQIEFVTFHQSYGYEEFVEGIKADLESDDVKYKLEEGVFKKLCEKATRKQFFYIGQKIAKYEVISNSVELLKLKRENGTIIPIPMYLIMEVFTLISNSIITPEDLNNKTAINKMSETTEKYIINGYPNIFRDLAQYYLEYKDANLNDKNYILIIDEINRGNISKIFGELITLIEPSKRIGEEEEIFLKLSNSPEPFGVPSNLYIIGTMNTADRSIAQIDTALRRRFEFVEMMPKVELFDNIFIDGIDIKEMIIAINERIEYIYDREHTIGHSYFLPLVDTPTKDKLDEIFSVNIIPLLAEYFYGDWADIISILNNDFIKEKELKYKPKNIHVENKVYEVNDTFTLEQYKKIYAGDSE